MHKVVVVALDGVVTFDLSIPLLVFGHSDVSDFYSVEVCGVAAGEVTTSDGLRVTITRGVRAWKSADTIVVPGYEPHREPRPAALTALHAAHARGTRLVSVCTGAFALAEAGLLDGRSATTHWRDTAELASTYPDVRVDPDVLFVDEDSVMTSAGLAAGLDLCLHIVRRDLGEHVAAELARDLVTAPQRSGGQAQFIRRPSTSTVVGTSASPTMAAVCEWAVQRLDQPLTIAAFARQAAQAPRTFSRQFSAATGTTPIRWLTDQRILRARELLETTDLSVELVAQRCGLGTAANLRVHFSRDTSTTPTAYRHAFRAP